MKMICLAIFIVFLTSGGSVFGAGHVCDDWDSQACVLLASSHPDICNSTLYSMDSCRRFCGNCPIECYNCPNPVRDVTNCTAIASCAQGEQCVLKHYLAADGHHEYIMGCEQDEICHSLTSEFGASVATAVIGKRDATVDDVTSDDDVIERTRRTGISISCCDTDVCNLPIVPTTTTMPVHAGCDYIDLVFVVDESGSVGQKNFIIALNFVKAVIEHFNVGLTTAQTAFVGFSTNAKVYWHLFDFLNINTTVEALNHIHYVAGSTATADALDVVRTDVLTTVHGDRAGARNVIIVVTDGRSVDTIKTFNSASLLHGVADHVVAIGIGPGLDNSELNAIATSPQDVLGVTDYGSLPSAVNKTLALICP